MDYIWIINKNTFKQPIEKNCKKIGCQLPEKHLIYLSAKFVQKIMIENKIQPMNELFHRPNRSTSKYPHKYQKKKIYRTALEYKIQLFNQFPLEIMFL